MLSFLHIVLCIVVWFAPGFLAALVLHKRDKDFEPKWNAIFAVAALSSLGSVFIIFGGQKGVFELLFYAIIIFFSGFLTAKLMFNEPSKLLYIVKRVVLFIPTFFIITLLAFFILKSSPMDPVEAIANSKAGKSAAQQNNVSNDQVKAQVRKRLGLDKPSFYFSFGTLADSDKLHEIVDQNHRKNLHRLTRKYGNWEEINNYYNSIKRAKSDLALLSVDSTYQANTEFLFPEIIQRDTALEGWMVNGKFRPLLDSSNKTVLYKKNCIHLYDSSNTDSVKEWVCFKKDTVYKEYRYRVDSSKRHIFKKDDINNAKNTLLNNYNTLLESENDAIVKDLTLRSDSLFNAYSFLAPFYDDYKNLKKARRSMEQRSTSWKNYIPSIQINGMDNQYHAWLVGTRPFGSKDTTLPGGLIRGDFGLSYLTGESVNAEIWRKFKISFELVLIAVVLAYLISIPIGVYGAYKKDSLFDKGSSIILFILYSLPNFFVALLLIRYFSNPDNFMWFYSNGYHDYTLAEDAYYELSYWERLKHSAPYMVLPIATYCYAMFAFISRIMRVGMLETLNQDYIRTARAKGLSETRVVWKHAFKNSLLPIITIFANIFPLAVGGSVIIEMIFSYNGMGMASLKAIYEGDYPIVIAVFCLAGMLTMVGYLVSDIMYTLVDPRISLSKKK